jgi:hypothetical protein
MNIPEITEMRKYEQERWTAFFRVESKESNIQIHWDSVNEVRSI